MPDSVKCLRDIKSNDEWFSEVPKRGWPSMSKIGKKIPCRSCLTEAILVIGKKIVRFKMFDEVGIKQSFENLGNSRSESNRPIVGGVRAVTLLRYRLNKCMLPRRRICTGNKDEAKKRWVAEWSSLASFRASSSFSTRRTWRRRSLVVEGRRATGWGHRRGSVISQVNVWLKSPGIACQRYTGPRSAHHTPDTGVK